MNKHLVLGLMIGALPTTVTFFHILEKQQKQTLAVLDRAEVYRKIIHRYIEVVDVDISKQIVDEFQFDFITVGLERELNT